MQPLGEGQAASNAPLAPQPSSQETATFEFTEAPAGEGTACSADLDQLPDLSKVEKSEVFTECSR